jgi:hypothetical protein
MSLNRDARDHIRQQVEEQFERLIVLVKKGSPTALVQRFFPWTPDPLHHDSEDYKNAEKWWREFDCKTNVDYSEVLQYAKEAFAKCESVDQANDAKANSIIQYLSGGTAIVALVAPFTVRYDTIGAFNVSMGVIGCLIPSFLLAIAAVWNAVSVRQPQPSRTLPAVTFAAEMADFHSDKDKTKTLTWLILHPIIEAGIIRNAYKAKLLDAAHKYYKASIACLILPFASLLVTLPQAAPKGVAQIESAKK